MDKKLILIISGIILLVIMGALVFTGSDQRIKVGVVSFSLPEGFEQGKYNEVNDINITNGVTEIFLKEYPDKNIDKILENYENITHKRGNNISFSNFTVNNITVYKSNIPNQKNNDHYWFVYGDKTYSIYFWDNTPNKDSYVTELISSIRNAN